MFCSRHFMVGHKNGGAVHSDDFLQFEGHPATRMARRKPHSFAAFEWILSPAQTREGLRG